MCGQPRICVGTKPVDGGHLILDATERRAILEGEPQADAILRPFIGGYEFINGAKRWLLHAQSASPAEIRAMPEVRRRIAAVREFRGKGGPLALSLVGDPTSYHVTVVPESSYLVIPEVSSERRDYVPIGWVEPPTIPSNKLLVIEGASLWHFAILTSRSHMSWLRHIGGKLKSDFQYSSGLVYNTFPWPLRQAQGERAWEAQRAKIEALAQTVLDARALPKNATSTLADLYDPDTMPPELRKAHRDLDAAVDKLYAPKGFADDRARVEHLFKRYEELVLPTMTAPAANRRTNRRAARALAAGGAAP